MKGWKARLRRLLGGEGPAPTKTFPCPECGAAVVQGALACRACGSDAETGWSPTAQTASVDLGSSADDFDYEAFVEREFQAGQPSSSAKRAKRRRIVLALLIALFALLLTFSGWSRLAR